MIKLNNNDERDKLKTFFKIFDIKPKYQTAYIDIGHGKAEYKQSIYKLLTSSHYKKNIRLSIQEYYNQYGEHKDNDAYDSFNKYDNKIKRVKGLFLDIDYKDYMSKNPYYVTPDRFSVSDFKKWTIDRLTSLPIKPNTIICTRNGVHVCYRVENLLREDYRTFQAGFCNYIEDELQIYPDYQASLSLTACVRFPYSHHQKYEDKDLYRTTIEYINQDIHDIKDFDFVPQVAKKVNKPIHKQNAPSTNTVNTTNLNINTIKDLDYVTMKTILQVNNKPATMNAKEFKEYVKAIDLQIFLSLNKHTFKDIFHDEKTPSASIQYSNNSYYYHCFSQSNPLHIDIIDIVERIANTDYKTACDFLAKVFSINIEQQVNHTDIIDIINDNIDTYNQLKKIHPFLKKLESVYYVYHSFIDENMRQKNMYKLNYNQAVSARYLAEQCRKYGKNKNQTKNYMKFLLLIKLKIIKQIDKPDGIKEIVMYNNGVNYVQFSRIDFASTDKLCSVFETANIPISKLSAKTLEQIFFYE